LKITPARVPGGVQAAGFVDPVHQLAFVVALAEVQLQPVRGAGFFAQLLDVGQRGRAVHGGLARAEQVEVGAVEDEGGFHRVSFKSGHRCQW
jgi:hypothetical protein